MDRFALLPAIVFDHVGKFNNKFSFFVFLTALKGMFLEGKSREKVSGRTHFYFLFYYSLGKQWSLQHYHLHPDTLSWALSQAQEDPWVSTE